jgi:hypothetical protein
MLDEEERRKTIVITSKKERADRIGHWTKDPKGAIKGKNSDS